MQNLWDQQPKETNKAYERFRLYRDMGAGRSLRKLAKELGLDLSSIAEMSSRYRWQERVSAFDAYIDEASQHKSIIQVKAMKERQIALALKAQKAATKGLEQLISRISQQEAHNFRPEALVKLLEIGCRLERLNRDEPDQKIEVSQKYNYDRLTLEECDQLHDLIKKATSSL